MDTGEDKQGLRKILDMTRMISIAILAIHIYLSCYQGFVAWGLTSQITDRLLKNIAHLGVFAGLFKAKLAALVCLLISLVGASGKKDEKTKWKNIVTYLFCGLVVYGLAFLVFYLHGAPGIIANLYIGFTAIGYLLILAGGTRLSRLIRLNLNKDIFNRNNETFPQKNLPAF